jgi:hypothetical protein
MSSTPTNSCSHECNWPRGTGLQEQLPALTHGRRSGWSLVPLIHAR